MLEVDVVNKINKYLKNNEIKYVNEVRMGIGIPDISFNLGCLTKLKLINDYYLILVLNFINEKLKPQYQK